jgi:type III restriction enzyme
METCERDASVDAFCKINEQKHTFARLRYIKEDGLPAFYSPDFFVLTAEHIYLVETKAQSQITSPNVVRKRKAGMRPIVFSSTRGFRLRSISVGPSTGSPAR